MTKPVYIPVWKIAFNKDLPLDEELQAMTIAERGIIRFL